MKEWISHVTKLGAIGSVLFFALELHQNSLQIEAQSRDALVTLYNSTDGAN